MSLARICRAVSTFKENAIPIVVLKSRDPRLSIQAQAVDSFLSSYSGTEDDEQHEKQKLFKHNSVFGK